MGIIEGFRLYPKAAAWSMLLSTAIIMEGYDVVLLASFYAFPQFNQKYGTMLPDGTYQVPAAWQAGLSNGANVGEIIGLFANGIISERYGYRKTMIVSLSAVICFIFIPFFAQNVQTLEVAEILCGIPWGVFQTLTTAYAAEVMPVPLRCYLCTYVNLCWVLGQLIASGVLRGFLGNHTEWAYRVPFAIQWIWPLPIIIGVIFAPESPWWLVRRGRIDDAKKALLRLTSKNDSNFNANDTIDMMIHTNALEKEISAGTSYWDCFKGIDLRRTEIVVGVWMIQNLCGSAFMGYSTYFYEQAGLATENAFDMSMAQYALGAIGTFLSWFLMARAGRRKIYLYGLLVLDVMLLIIGFVGIAPSSNKAASWVIGSMLLIYTFTCTQSPSPPLKKHHNANQTPQTTSPSAPSATPSSPSSPRRGCAPRRSCSRATPTTSSASSTTSGRRTCSTRARGAGGPRRASSGSASTSSASCGPSSACRSPRAAPTASWTSSSPTRSPPASSPRRTSPSSTARRCGWRR